MKKHPRKIWAAGFNLGGLWNDEPIAMHWASALDCWYDDTGNLSVENLGLDKQGDGSLTTFSSTNKREVEIFLLACKTVGEAVNRLFVMSHG
jgi:hypothetical protein